MPRRFCAICGKDLDENSPHFGMCLECYLKENPLFSFPSKFRFKICADCSSFTKREKWIKPKEQEILNIISEAIRIYLLDPYKDKTIVFDIELDEDSIILTSKNLIKKIEIIIHGYREDKPEFHHQEPIEIIIDYDLCKNCNRLRSGSYYVSIIQLRVKREAYLKKINEIMRIIQPFVENQFKEDQRQYITKFVETKYGADLYVSTKNLTNQILKILEHKYNFVKKRSRKLVSRNTQEGKNIYRQKFLIKFLPVEKHDIIEINNEAFEVSNILKNKVVLLSNKKKKRIENFEFFFKNKFRKIRDGQ